MGISSYQVEVGGRTVRYKAAGEGEPVVLVHGLSGSTRWWARNVQGLARTHTVYMVDLPGFGTMRSLRPQLALQDAASWLSAWIEAVGLGSVHLVGHSMGGYVCITLAAQHPNAVRRLVLVAPAAVSIRRSWPVHLLPLLSEAVRVAPALLPVLAYDALRAGPLTLWRAARDLLASDTQQHLRAVQAPTLLIWGEQDALIPPSMGYLLREEIPGARLLTLKGTGHVPMFDRPSEFNAVVLAFLGGAAVGE